MQNRLLIGLATSACLLQSPVLAQAPASAPAAPALTLAATVPEVLEDFRRSMILFDLRYEFNVESLGGPDPARMELYPFPGAWPGGVTAPVRRADGYRPVRDEEVKEGGLPPSENSTGGYVFSSPLTTGLTPEHGGSFLLLNGVTKGAGIVTSGYLSAYIRGEMAGLLNCMSYTTLIVRGDATGTIHLGSYANGVIYGAMRGRLITRSSCNLYLMGGFTGTLELGKETSRVYIAGKTPETALRNIKGSGEVFLESSTLAPGNYERGEVSIRVLDGDGTTKPSTGEKTSSTSGGEPPIQAAVPRHLKPFASGPELKDVADVPQQDLRARGNKDMRYALIGPRPDAQTPPPGGYKLLLILPGGEGSPDFNPFVRRIAKFATPPGYLVANLVAPVWAESQGKNLVWPTRINPWSGMGFATEDFIEAVVAEIKAKYPVNAAHIYALGWSSGGPPVYAALLAQNSSLTGAYVAMSVFQKDNLPPVAGAKGKVVYLLHSPQDFIKISQAQSARDTLAGAGAHTILSTYPGGHGWRDDPFGRIYAGLQWLEKNSVQ